MDVKVIFDPVCPWCYIGKRRFEAAKALRPGVPIAIRWRPFLLNPDIPPGGIDRSAYLARKFGSEARISRIYGAIADAGLSVEIDFDFDRIRQTPNSLNAHRLVRYAERADRIDRTDQVVEALFHSYFVQGRDIGEVDVLVEVARDLSFEPAEIRAYLESDEDVMQVYEENARAHRLGLNGVPAFVFEGGMAISGAQDPKIIARVLDVALAGETAA